MDLDNTAHCPLDTECVACGRVDRDTLEAVTIDTGIGIACLTLCTACAESGHLPALYYPQAADMVLPHSGLPGTDLEHMAAVRHAEGGDR